MIIRQAHISDAPIIAALQLQNWRTVYADILPEKQLELSYQKQLNYCIKKLNGVKKDNVIFVAEIKPGKIIGYISGVSHINTVLEFHGEIDSIYVLEEFRRRGIGRRMVKSFLEKAGQSVKKSLAFWAPKSPASCKFCESVKGIKVRVNTIEIAGISCEFLNFVISENEFLSEEDLKYVG